MGIFGGIGNVAANNESRGAYFETGDYLVNINKFIAKMSREGKPLVIIETTVLEQLVGADGSNSPGTKATAIFTLERGPDGKLTFRGEKAASRVKAFVAAVAGVEPENITEAMCEDLAENDGAAISGIPLRIRAERKVSQKGAGFTEYEFYPAG